MTEKLYDADVLDWSRQQSRLLRRLARGERVNDDVDWPHVIEEIEDVGQSALRAVRALLERALEHMLKCVAWPDGPVEHWRHETLVFLVDARRNFTPSMRRPLDLAKPFATARALVLVQRIEGRPPGALPERNPFAIGDLLPPGPPLPDLNALVGCLKSGE